jgi:hypothetical protein
MLLDRVGDERPQPDSSEAVPPALEPPASRWAAVPAPRCRFPWRLACESPLRARSDRSVRKGACRPVGPDEHARLSGVVDELPDRRVGVGRREEPPRYESGFRAHGSNQQFHRLLRHAVARALTTAPSLAGVSPAAADILIRHGWRRKGRPGRCRIKPSRKCCCSVAETAARAGGCHDVGTDAPRVTDAMADFGTHPSGSRTSFVRSDSLLGMEGDTCFRQLQPWRGRRWVPAHTCRSSTP